MRRAINTSLAGLITVMVVAWLVQHSAAGQVASTESPANWQVPKTAWGHPDLQGIWDPTTGTPLERPAQYKDKEFLTDEEAAERERTRFAQFDSPDRPGNRTGDYGSVWREGSKNALNRTSLIVDPKDGRLPPLTAAAKEAAAAREARR